MGLLWKRETFEDATEFTTWERHRITGRIRNFRQTIKPEARARFAEDTRRYADYIRALARLEPR